MGVSMSSANLTKGSGSTRQSMLSNNVDLEKMDTEKMRLESDQTNMQYQEIFHNTYQNTENNLEDDEEIGNLAGDASYDNFLDDNRNNIS